MEGINSGQFYQLDSEYQELIDARGWMDTPELRLVWAVIERAVRDALGNQRVDEAMALEWFWEEHSDTPSPFAFEWCCEVLDVKPEDLRERILEQRKKLHKGGLCCSVCRPIGIGSSPNPASLNCHNFAQNGLECEAQAA